MEQLGAGCRREGVQALSELALELIGTHGMETSGARGAEIARRGEVGVRPEHGNLESPD